MNKGSKYPKGAKQSPRLKLDNEFVANCDMELKEFLREIDEVAGKREEHWENILKQEKIKNANLEKTNLELRKQLKEKCNFAVEWQTLVRDKDREIQELRSNLADKLKDISDLKAKEKTLRDLVCYYRDYTLKFESQTPSGEVKQQRLQQIEEDVKINRRLLSDYSDGVKTLLSHFEKQKDSSASSSIKNGSQQDNYERSSLLAEIRALQATIAERESKHNEDLRNIQREMAAQNKVQRDFYSPEHTVKSAKTSQYPVNPQEVARLLSQLSSAASDKFVSGESENMKNLDLKLKRYIDDLEAQVNASL